MTPRVHIIILAAGTSNRFGALKQLQPLGGLSLVRRAALTALATGLPVLAVIGANAEAVGAELRDLPLRLLHNPEWSRGMGHSLALAVRRLSAESPALAAVLVTLADQPLIESADLAALVREYLTAPSDEIVAADHGDTLGPPCLFPSPYFPALAALDGDRGARVLLREHGDKLRRIAMPHAAIDIDTPDDLAHAEAVLGQRGA